MKKLIFCIIFFAHALACYGQSRPTLGVGVLLGEPTALSGKYFMGTHAVDAGLSYNNHEVLIFGDYLKHFPGKLGKENAFIAGLTPYAGIGPVFAFGDNDKHRHGHRDHFIDDDDDDFAFGARIPFGLEWMGKEYPVGVSLEIVPGIVVVPETDAFVQGGFAIRYYF